MLDLTGKCRYPNRDPGIWRVSPAFQNANAPRENPAGQEAKIMHTLVN